VSYNATKYNASGYGGIEAWALTVSPGAASGLSACANLDTVTLAGKQFRLIEATHTTDAWGRVGFAETGITLVVKRGPDKALQFVSDANFCAFVLQGIDEPDKYAVGVYHPALGLRIAPSPGSTKPISETLVMGWKCPNITIEHDGVVQAYEYVTFTVERQTVADGIVEHQYGADIFVDTGSGTTGEWMTNAAGRVMQNRANGTGLHDIYFPNGHGALFQRENDLRDDHADKPDEYAATVWCYHRGERVRVLEGEDVTLNVEGGTIAFTGTPSGDPPGVVAHAWHEDVAGTPAPTTRVKLDGAGNGTITGLVPGKYICVERIEGDLHWTQIAARTTCTVIAGATTEVALPALAAPPADTYWLYAYDEAGDPVSADLYSEAPVGYIGSGSQIAWTEADMTASGGTWPCVVVLNDTGFYVRRDADPPDRICYEVTARGRCILIDPEEAGGYVWFRDDTAHRDLYWQTMRPPYLLVERNGRQPSVGFESIPRGVRSEPVRVRPAPEQIEEIDPGTGLPTGDYTWQWSADGDYIWDLEAHDESVLNVAPNTSSRTGDPNGLYQDPATPLYDQQIGSSRISPKLVGGKLSGNIVDGHFTRIHSGNLTEADRYGLEWGDWRRHEVRVLSGDGGDDNVHVGCITGNTCPYCHGPVWRWPSASGYLYGYCMQTLCWRDARSWVRLPSVGSSVASDDYDVRALRYRPNNLSDRLLDKWLRPVDYLETDAYISGGRWVVQHPTLATWSGNAFTDGADNAAIAATNELVNTVYVQPKVIPATIVADATYTITCTMADGYARDFLIPLPAGLDLPKQMTTSAKVVAADAEGVTTPAACDFIADVTNITSSLSEDPNSFRVVGDTPAFIDAPTPITRLAQTPWACQFLSLFGQPDIDIGRIDGITHLAWMDAGSIYYAQVDDGLEGWRYGAIEPEAGSVHKRLVMDGATTGPWDNPSVTRLPDDRIVVTGHDRGRAKTAAFISINQGETWEAVALLGDGLTLVNAKADRSGVIHIAGYSEAKMWYQRSDDGGKTLCEFGGGGTVKEIAAADAQQPGVVPIPDGRVLVVVALDNKVRPMVSDDGGETWAVADVID